MLKIIKKNSIQTTRLQIKPFTNNNESTLIKLLTNDDITKTFMLPEFESSEQVKNLANKLINFSQISDFNHLEYGIYLNDFLIGFIIDCGFHDEEIEIGYVIDPKYKGNGYATEAVQAVLQELKYMGFKKVVAGFFEENKDSYRVRKMSYETCRKTSIEMYHGIQHTCYFCEIIF